METDLVWKAFMADGAGRVGSFCLGGVERSTWTGMMGVLLTAGFSMPGMKNFHGLVCRLPFPQHVENLSAGQRDALDVVT